VRDECPFSFHVYTAVTHTGREVDDIRGRSGMRQKAEFITWKAGAAPGPARPSAAGQAIGAPAMEERGAGIGRARPTRVAG
jgi:hypothetical protein